jgi:hypothetical protein
VAQFAVFIPYIVAAAGTLLQGASGKGASGSQALQLEQQAGQDRASSQRAAAEQRRSARYVQSRVQALAAASGAGATDPSVVDLIGDIGGEGEYGALSALYEGESAARGAEFGAKVARKQGSAIATSSYLKAGSTLLAGAGSWYDKYGGQGAPGGVRKSVVQGTALSDYQNKSGIYSARYA